MLMKAEQYIIPYNDLVEMFYISMCNRFIVPHNPAVALMGFSEIEHVIKECFNGVLYEIINKPRYIANLDETLFPMFREKLKHMLMYHGFTEANRHISWFDNFLEEIIFPKIMERVEPLRHLGIYKYRLDWAFDQGCILVKL